MTLDYAQLADTWRLGPGEWMWQARSSQTAIIRFGVNGAGIISSRCSIRANADAQTVE